MRLKLHGYGMELLCECLFTEWSGNLADTSTENCLKLNNTPWTWENITQFALLEVLQYAYHDNWGFLVILLIVVGSKRFMNTMDVNVVYRATFYIQILSSSLVWTDCILINGFLSWGVLTINIIMSKGIWCRLPVHSQCSLIRHKSMGAFVYAFCDSTLHGSIDE